MNRLNRVTQGSDIPWQNIKDLGVVRAPRLVLLLLEPKRVVLQLHLS